MARCAAGPTYANVGSATVTALPQLGGRVAIHTNAAPSATPATPIRERSTPRPK